MFCLTKAHNSAFVIFAQGNIAEQGKLLHQHSFVVWEIHKNMLRQITKLRGKHRQVFLFEKSVIFSKKEAREMENGKEGYVYQFKSSMKVCDFRSSEDLFVFASSWCQGFILCIFLLDEVLTKE